jgi:hypothetical protein
VTRIPIIGNISWQRHTYIYVTSWSVVPMCLTSLRVWATARLKTCEVNDGLMRKEKTALFVSAMRVVAFKDESLSAVLNVFSHCLYNSSRTLWKTSDSTVISRPCLLKYARKQAIGGTEFKIVRNIHMLATRDSKFSLTSHMTWHIDN